MLHHAIAYGKGLMQAPTRLRNMERMEESVPDVEYDQLQHFISDSTWDHRAVMDEVARRADTFFDGHRDTCLLIDETSFPKKGSHSAGVARQWCGRLGKLENCQVGVFAVLGCQSRAVPVGAKLYLPEEWTSDEDRCTKARIPVEDQTFQTKPEQALNLIDRLRDRGIRYNWIAADGVYGGDTTFLRQLDERNETFVMDVRSNQRVFLDDPQPAIPPAPENGRPTTIMRSDAQSIRVDEHIAALADKKWRRVRLRSGTQGDIWTEAIAMPVWIWPQKGEGRKVCSQWTLIVTRDSETKGDIKYSLTNAESKTALRRLAYMQRQRFWVEHAFKEAKTTCGLADYQVRTWIGWHHHVALVMMVHEYMCEERADAPEGMELLSANDVRDILVTFLPKPSTTPEDVMRRIRKRHRKRAQSFAESDEPVPKTPK